MNDNIIELSSDDSNHSFHSDKSPSIPGNNNLQEGSTTPPVSEACQSSASEGNRQTNTRNKRTDCTGSQIKEHAKAGEKKLAEETKAIIDKRNKIYKPGECMKHMIIEMHPVLLETWFCADVVREATSAGVKVKASSAICDTALVLWSRSVPQNNPTNNNGMTRPGPVLERCAAGLYACDARDAAALVARRALAAELRRARELACCRITLVVYGVKDYFKTSGRKTANSSAKLITQGDLENAIADLLVSEDCDTVQVNTPNELALTIIHFTKAVAEEPYKLAMRGVEECADVYLREKRSCVAVDKRGNGLSRLWQQMVAVLPMASLESSRALCARYPTPLTMFEALQKPGGASDVADVGVTRTALPGSKTRRIGPEFARKLELFFTATDGKTLID